MSLLTWDRTLSPSTCYQTPVTLGLGSFWVFTILVFNSVKTCFLPCCYGPDKARGCWWQRCARVGEGIVSLWHLEGRGRTGEGLLQEQDFTSFLGLAAFPLMKYS